MIQKHILGDVVLHTDEGGPVSITVGGLLVMGRDDEILGGFGYRESVINLRRKARGRMLMAGLGIGLHIRMCQEECGSITVVEVNRNVIDLVRQYVDRRVNIIHADFNEYIMETDDKYDIVWVDHLDHHDGIPKHLRKRYSEHCPRLLADDESELLFWDLER